MMMIRPRRVAAYLNYPLQPTAASVACGFLVASLLGGG
jgi:hypothetical protein